jgi:hypothetical protein
MTNVTGQILRMVGMLIELFVVWRVCAQNDERLMTRITLPGGATTAVAWLAMGVGIAIWLTGTALVASSRRRRPAPERDSHQIEL